MKANIIRERLKENIVRDIEQIHSREGMLERLPIELVSQAFPEGVWSEWWQTQFEFTLPLRFDLIAEFQEFCKLQGYSYKASITHIWNAKDAGTFADIYVDDKTNFHLAFRSGRTGATCVINKIGEEMKPIFEIICPEGAKENTFGDK